MKFKFDNWFARALPADDIKDVYPRQVPGASYSVVPPTPVKAPSMMAYSHEVATLLDLSPEDCISPAFGEVFGGNRVLEGMEPIAVRYGGHQFGHWAGQLGDGRAITLGETINKGGERWELQLKGAGPTPYSRRGDGRAVLRSSIREFLCSEAMYHLGVPTTRALSLVTTGDPVMRDMFYDGNGGYEPGAIVCRVAPSFLRFGNFEIHAANREQELLQQLLDFAIKRDFPHLGEPSMNTYASFFLEVCESTAAMVVQWMRVGFVHGVMNTDNMSILGLTIDYGPYGWLEGYEPGWTPNTTDSEGKRYSFGNQPGIASWNLLQLANALHPIITDASILEAGLLRYKESFESGHREMMIAKLGLESHQGTEDDNLIESLSSILQLAETDMTLFYRGLAKLEIQTVQGEQDLLAPIMDAYYDPEAVSGDAWVEILGWLSQYQRRVETDGQSDDERKAAMNAVNPKYVMRNYIAQLAIDKAEEGDPSLVSEILEVMRNPYNEQSEFEKFAAKRPEWARNRPGCSMLSCSS